VDIDGKPRPAFQCGTPWSLKGIRWYEIDGRALGLDGARSYPVYLQAHALRRLRERLAPSLIPETVITMGLMWSLPESTVVRRGGDYLIAFSLTGIRVGYLVARVVAGLLVVTTFLFLTMKGTPEGQLLREKLGLSHRDIEYEGLDRLETFLAPDVLADKALVKVLDESGCGSLLELARDGFPHKAVAGRAEDLKKFLQITDGAGRKPSRWPGRPKLRTT
jgi:hypothetical protein